MLKSNQNEKNVFINFQLGSPAITDNFQGFLMSLILFQGHQFFFILAVLFLTVTKGEAAPVVVSDPGHLEDPKYYEGSEGYEDPGVYEDPGDYEDPGGLNLESLQNRNFFSVSAVNNIAISNNAGHNKHYYDSYQSTSGKQPNLAFGSSPVFASGGGLYFQAGPQDPNSLFISGGQLCRYWCKNSNNEVTRKCILKFF